MLVIWLGSLAAVINQLRKKCYKIFRETFSRKNQIKRIGVYYMCIDNFLL